MVYPRPAIVADIVVGPPGGTVIATLPDPLVGPAPKTMLAGLLTEAVHTHLGWVTTEMPMLPPTSGTLLPPDTVYVHVGTIGGVEQFGGVPTCPGGQVGVGVGGITTTGGGST